MKRRFVLLLLSTLAATAATSDRPRDLLSKLPLRFEVARGEDGDKDAKYVARGTNFVLSLATTRSWLDWTDAEHRKVAHVRTSFVNASPQARVEGEDRLPGTANYFIGAAANWRTDVTGFARVRYRDVYPGVDLVFHGEAGKLEYDFVLAPHADPGMIRLELTGHRSVSVGPEGDLIVSTSAGEIRWKKPEIYQEERGTRLPVNGRFMVIGKRTVKFEVAAYDLDRTLVIDPTLSYSTYLGGSDYDTFRGIGRDTAGNVYLAGNSNSMDLSTISAYQPNFGGRSASNAVQGDGMVAKFSPTGTLLYLTYIGGSRDEYISAIAVDAAGDAYITGSTTSTNFPVVNAFQAQFGGTGGLGNIVRTGDAFVAKLNPTGNRLIYSTYLGGSYDDVGFAIAIDSSGNAYVAGATLSMNFPVSADGSAYQGRLRGAGGEPIKTCLTCTGPFWDPGDAFIAKLDPTGSQLIFSTYLGGFQDDAAWSIALDSSNNVYVGGCTISADFPVTSKALQTRFGGVDIHNFQANLGDGFIAKLNPTGSGLLYSTFLGGSGDDCVTAIAVDSTGSVYMTGSTTTTNLPTSTGAFQPAYAGYQSNAIPNNVAQNIGDAFVAKLDPTGSTLVYLSYLGGAANDGGTAIAIDPQGDAFVAGFTNSLNFPVAGTPIQTNMAGNGGKHFSVNVQGDAFLTVVNPSGTGLAFSTYFGGSSDDGIGGLVLDGNGNVYVAGGTSSKNLPTTTHAAQLKNAGESDAFYAVFSGFPMGAPVITSVVNAFGNSTTIAPNTWVAIKGTGLSATSRIWQGSDFINNQMPITLDGVTVTMNGENAYVYYISGTQLNILTPPDLATGPVQVQVSLAGVTSGAFTVQAQPYSISFFVFNGGPYVVAAHLDGTLVGPTTLFPGASTPAKPGEQIYVYANGFGPTTPPVIKGSAIQMGTIPGTLPLQVGGTVAQVVFAGLVSPGLYQFNFVIPLSTPNGDIKIQAEAGGQVTPAALVTVQQ